MTESLWFCPESCFLWGSLCSGRGRRRDTRTVDRHVLRYSHRDRLNARGPPPLLGHRRMCCPECMPLTSLCVLSSASHPLSSASTSSTAGKPLLPPLPFHVAVALGTVVDIAHSKSWSTKQVRREKSQRNPVSVSMAVTVVTAGSTGFRLSLVLPPSPFAHLSSALTPQPVPKCWAVMISPYLQLLWKKQSFSSQVMVSPGWSLLP